MLNHCKTCGILDQSSLVCRLHRAQKDPEKDYCSQWTNELSICEKCGQGALKPAFTQDQNEIWHTLCLSCAQQLNSCAFCTNANKCEFETNPSPLPKTVQVKVQRGPQTIITTVKNPDRIRETCISFCPCFSKEFGCMKEFKYCDNIEYIYGKGE